MDEEHPLNPRSPYAGAKAGADRLVYSYYATYGIPAVIVRPFNNYGPRQHLEKVVPRFITSALDGRPLTVHGDGTASRDWLYVDDTVRGARPCCSITNRRGRGPCEVYNLGTGRSISVNEIAEQVAAAVGRDCRSVEHIGDRPGQVARHAADASTFHAALRVEPGGALRRGPGAHRRVVRAHTRPGGGGWSG